MGLRGNGVLPRKGGRVIGCGRAVLQHWAEEELARLAVDAGRDQLYDRVNDILDAIEDDHTTGDLRRRRFANPPVWAVKVYGSEQDYLVLWSETSDGVLIHYIGPDVL